MLCIIHRLCSKQAQPEVKLSLSHNFEGPKANMNGSQTFLDNALERHQNLGYTVTVEKLIRGGDLLNL